MRNNLLKGSAFFVGLATLIGIGVTLFASNPEILSKGYRVSGILGLGSIGLFFIGLEYEGSNGSNKTETKKLA